MDPITHGLLGASVSQSITTRALGRWAALIGTLAGMAPDLDIFIRSSTDPLVSILYHRNFTHSLAFVPLGGLIVALFYIVTIKALRSKWPVVLLAGCTAYLTHSLLDATTSYGTLLWWPFSHQRVAWDLLSIVDPIVTSILAVGVIFSLRKRLAHPARIALLVFLSYLSLAAWQHHRALTAQTQLTQQRQQLAVKQRVMPLIGHIFVYYSIYISNNQIFLDHIHVPLLGKAYVTTGGHLPWFSQRDLPLSVQTNKKLMHNFNLFSWFSDDYLSAFTEKPLLLGDLRYLRHLSPPQTLWTITFTTQ